MNYVTVNSIVAISVAVTGLLGMILQAICVFKLVGFVATMKTLYQWLIRFEPQLIMSRVMMIFIVTLLGMSLFCTMAVVASDPGIVNYILYGLVMVLFIFLTCMSLWYLATFKKRIAKESEA